MRFANKKAELVWPAAGLFLICKQWIAGMGPEPQPGLP
jgi:hypothetical protein